jgi:resolvase domain protein
MNISNIQRENAVSTEPQATIVRQTHIKFSSGSYSCKSLAEAIKAEYGTNFHKGKINLILRDKFYIDIMTDKKTGQEYPHYYEKLVSDDIFEQNQAILGSHSSKRRRYAGILSVYRGLIKPTRSSILRLATCLSIFEHAEKLFEARTD